MSGRREREQFVGRDRAWRRRLAMAALMVALLGPVTVAGGGAAAQAPALAGGAVQPIDTAELLATMRAAKQGRATTVTSTSFDGCPSAAAAAWPPTSERWCSTSPR